MKTINVGKNLLGWSTTHKCTGCNAELLVEESDIFLKAKDGHADLNEADNLFRCNLCGQINTGVNLPTEVKNRLIGKSQFVYGL